MTTYNWYKIFNKTEFEATGLVSRSLQYFFESRGLVDILITKGNMLGVLFDTVFLMVGLNEQNPVAMDHRALYLDDNDDVWVGIEIEA